MLNLAPTIANSLWYLTCLLEARAFRRAQQDVAGAQRDLLLGLLRRNAGTAFGRMHGFAAMRSIAEYQARVPLTTYEDYRLAVERIGAGEAGVLTRERVLLLEPTGGSTGATRLIPYTATLRAEFQRAVAVWIADLFRHDPRLMAGSAYWSVSPVARPNQRSPGGLPIGFEDDSAYLGGMQRHFVQAIMAVPPQVRLIADMEALRYVTLLFLLRRRDLRLISVWNPTFLTLLLARLPGWGPHLAADIAEGTLTPPMPLAPDVHACLVARTRPDARRAAEVWAALGADSPLALATTRLWPHLRLISCWADAHAARYAPELAALFPQARLQGKGLIATEGFVSFPLVGQPGAALAIRSHFFEFIPASGGSVRLAHEVEPGGCYAVVLTTGGGLYRYQLHDLVEVVGRIDACPLLRFVGKAAHIADWFGEKLDERHVRAALDDLLGRQAITPAFVMLACDEQAYPPAYTLFIEDDHVPDAVLHRVGTDLEQALQANYHYRYCRDLGQLAALRVCRVVDGQATYLANCAARGQRAGDIKPAVLHAGGGWAQAFGGTWIGPEADD